MMEHRASTNRCRLMRARVTDARLTHAMQITALLVLVGAVGLGLAACDDMLERADSPTRLSTTDARAGTVRRTRLEDPASGDEANTIGPVLQQELSATELTVAERFAITLSLTSTSAEAPAWPAQINAIDGMTVIDSSDRGPEFGEDGQVTFTRRVTYEPFLPGRRVIPAIRLAVPLSNGTVRTLELSAMELEIRPLVDNPPTEIEALAGALSGDTPLAAAPPPRTIATRVWAQLGVGAAMLLLPLLLVARSLLRSTGDASRVTPLEQLRELLANLESDRGTLAHSALAQPTPAILDRLHHVLREVLATELGPRALTLSATELRHTLDAAGLQPAIAESVGVARTSVIARTSTVQWPQVPHSLRSAAVESVAAMDTCRFHPEASERARAWPVAIASARGVANEVERLTIERAA